MFLRKFVNLTHHTCADSPCRSLWKAPSQAQENRAGERIVGSGHGARERRQEVDLVPKISKVESPESIKVGPMPAETRPEPKASFGKADHRASKLSNAGERC